MNECAADNEHRCDGSRRADAGSAIVRPHPTLLRRGFLLCADSDTPVAPGADDICPVHGSAACVLWFVPWADARDLGYPTTEATT